MKPYNDRHADALLRLRHLGEHNAANRERLAAMAPRFARIAERHSNGTAPKAIAVHQLFQTPAIIAQRMVEYADLADGQRILEPSAGLGRILTAIQDDKIDPQQIVAVEVNQDCAAQLFHQFPDVRLRQGDFLEICHTLGTYDRILMNPPFKMGSDVRHITAARKLLKPGGRLVGICANGPRQQKLQDFATHWEELGPETFKAEGTKVHSVLFVIDA